MPSIPIHCKCMGGWFVLKSIAHGSKCPIVCLSMWVGNLVGWWKLARNSRFSCRMQQTKSLKLYMFTCKHQAWDLSRQSTSISLIIYQHFPSRNLCDLTWSCCYLLELGFGFDQSLPRGQPVGKSPYYRSFDRSANWRVEDSIRCCHYLPTRSSVCAGGIRISFMPPHVF